MYAATLGAGCSASGSGDCAVCGSMAPGYLFVADRDADAILRYDARTAELIDVFAAGAEMRVDRPSSVRLGPDASLYLAGFGRGDVVRYDVRTGELQGIFFADPGVLEEPVELLFRGSQLVVLGNDTRNAVVIDQAGAVADDFGYPDMRAAHDFAFGPDGLLYVGTDWHPQRETAIQVWDVTAGTLVRDFGGLDDLAAATGVAFASDGLLHVADSFRNQVVVFDPATGARDRVLVGEEEELLDEPLALDFGPDRALYVVDRAGVHRFDPATGDHLSWFVRAGEGPLGRARSITFVTEAAIAEREVR
jgi:DNA-binding beta-propeller fold protein YncE